MKIQTKHYPSIEAREEIKQKLEFNSAVAGGENALSHCWFNNQMENLDLFFLLLNQESKNIRPLSQIELGSLFLRKIYLAKPLYSVTDPLSPVTTLLPLAGSQKGKKN